MMKDGLLVMAFATVAAAVLLTIIPVVKYQMDTNKRLCMLVSIASVEAELSEAWHQEADIRCPRSDYYDSLSKED